MKDIFTTMEILLMTNTKFSAREYSDKNEIQPSKNNNQNKLVEACWNGMIPAVLPELFDKADNKKLIMWQLVECNHLLYTQLGEGLNLPEVEFTLNPYISIENCGLS
jgi:hypothetical protein